MTAIIAPEVFLPFTLATAAVVAAPGPGQALVLTRTLQGGLRPGLLTALGLEIGTVLHTLAASLGLSAVLMSSAFLFDVVKLVGAAYLVSLGLMAWRNGRGDGAGAPAPVAATSSRRLLLHAAATGTLNPKVALFFMAFLPQFVDPSRGSILGQFVSLGLTFAALGLAGDSAVALLGARARQRIAGASAWQTWRERVTGTVLIGLGLRLAVASRN